MSAPAAPGTTVADRYRLDAAAPGMDGTFQATDARLEREVTLRLFPVDGWSAEERGRFQRDVKTAARLAHANVAGVLDFGTDAELGVDFMVTEMLRGEQLSALLSQRGTPPFPFALRVLQEAAAGVAAGHRAGIIHGEIHPGSLFLSRGEEDRRVRVRVTGFGARSSAALRSGAARYAAPEALRRGAEMTPACDVFSLGVVALEILAGLPAHWGSTLAALVRGQPAELPSLAGQRPELPAALLEAVQRALSVDPAARFTDASGFAEALARVPVPAEARAAAPAPEVAPAVVVEAPPAAPPEVVPPVVAAASTPPAAAPPVAAPIPPVDPAKGAQRVSAPGWKVASATDLGDHLYIPPALLDTRKPAPAQSAVAPRAPAVSAPAVSAAPPAPPAPAPVVPAPVPDPVPAPAAAVVPLAASAAAEPVAVAVVHEGPLPTVRVPRLGQTTGQRRSPMLLGAGVAGLLVVAAVAFAATRPSQPAESRLAAAPNPQQRLAAPLPGAARPDSQVASTAETQPKAVPGAEPAPAAAVDPAAAETARREEERRREELRKREEARRLEDQQRAQQLATQQAAAAQMRQVAVPVAPPAQAAPERPVAVNTVVSRPEPAEVREAAPTVDPNRIYGAGEVDRGPVPTNRAELANELARSRPSGEPGGGQVVLGFVVLESGRVDPGSITVVSSTAVRFNGPARRVIGRARFQPATLNGRPVKVRSQLPLIFPEQ